jgi:RNA polymerase sigma-70 factor (ECF subfamily)
MEEKPTLRAVFEAEESPLLKFAYSLVGQRETAEDLVQEAFIRLHSHWEEVINPRAWLFRSIRNLALNHLRDHKRETPLEPSHDPSSNSPEPDLALHKLEAIGTLQLLLAELPPEERNLIRLKYHQDLKYDQISHQTGLSVGNVGYKLHHLLKSLADSLRRMGIETAEG